MTAPTVPPPARLWGEPHDPADPGSWLAGFLAALVEVDLLANQLGALSAPRVREWVDRRRADLGGDR